jgi:hypothetical protein
MVLLAVGALASCGSDPTGSGEPDTAPPFVSEWAPADEEEGVGLVRRIEVTFSEPMDASTIDASTIVVRGRAPIPHIDYDDATRTARVVPDTLFAPLAWHDIVVTDGVTDVSGNPLAAPDTSSFRTGPLDSAHLVDHLEPNGTTLGARDVVTDRVYHALTICDDDRDVFRFALDESSTVEARTSVRHADGVDWRIRFVGDDGVPYAELGWTATTGETRSHTRTLGPGLHYVDIVSNDEPFYVLYDLTIATTDSL